VPASVKKEVEDNQKKIMSCWSIFTGPIKDQSGKVVYKAGEVIPDDKQLSMIVCRWGVGKVQ
jgi:hypothetical protein